MSCRVFLPLAVLLSTLFYWIWWKSPLLGDLDNKIYDIVSLSDVKSPVEHSTVVVEIDEKSLAALGQWPWPRVVMAELFDKIAEAEPTSVAIDVIFPEADRTSPKILGTFYRDFFHLDPHIAGLPEALRDNDRLLADAMGRTNTTLALFFDPSQSVQKECFFPSASMIQTDDTFKGLFQSPYLLCNLDVLQRSAHGTGHIQASPDHDGILRRLPLFIRYHDVLLPSLGLAAVSTIDPVIKLKRTWNGEMEIEAMGQTLMADRKSQVLLHLYPREWYSRVSALDILGGKVDPEMLRGKFVLIGASAMGLYDHYTFSDGTVRPGVFAHATLIEDFFNGTLRVQPSAYKEISIILSALTAIVLIILMRLKKYLYVVLLFTMVSISAGAMTYVMFYHNVYVSIGYYLIPLSAYLFLLSIGLFLIYYRNQKRFYEKMSKANEAMIDSMALVAETRDTETGAHILRTKEYVQLLAKHLHSKGHHSKTLTREYIDNLYHAAPLHDVGKVGIPDNILKKPGKLTSEEFEVMKTHTTMGKVIIGNAMHQYQRNSMLAIAHNIAHCHHEKWDGTGYPNAVSGENIPLEARMMALADVYDALISRRYYKEPFSFEEAEKIIIDGSGKHFDPMIVEAFIAIKDEFRSIAERINHDLVSIGEIPEE